MVYDGNQDQGAFGPPRRDGSRVAPAAVWPWSWLETPIIGSLAVLGVSALIAGIIIMMFPSIIGRDSIWWSTITVRTQSWSRDALVYPIIGRDKNGLRARFDFVVFRRDIAWKRSSTVWLERGTRVLHQDDVLNEVLTRAVRGRLRNVTDVIAIGTASEEGRRVREKERAGARANTAANWIRRVTTTGTQIWELNLGQFRSRCSTAVETESTSWQRPFMMVSVSSKDPGVDLSEALSNAMTGKSNLPSPGCYTAFELERS